MNAVADPPRFTPLIVALLMVALPSGGAAVVHVPGDGTLEQAVAVVAEGDSIELAPGTYVPPSNGFNFGNLGKSFTIRAADPGTVVFDGSDDRPIVRVLNSSPSPHVITFEDIHFRRGRGETFQVAGGVTLIRARAVFERCRFDANTTSTGTTGGGALLLDGASAAWVRDSVFTGNRTESEGGAIVVYGNSVLTVGRSQFVANRANLPGHRPSSAGGAIAVLNGTVMIGDSRFQANEAGFAGGALYAYGVWTSPTSTPRTRMTIENSTFENNHARPAAGVVPPSVSQGGAIHTEDQATLSIGTSRFLSNSAEGGGGVNSYRGIVEITDSTFRGNVATGRGLANGYGGAIGMLSGDQPLDFLKNRRPGQLTVTRSMIQCRWGGAEVAAQTGGGIFASGDRNRLFGLDVIPMGSAAANRARVVIDEVAIVDCTVVETVPKTGEGGGFEFALVDLDFRDSIVSGSRAEGPNGNGGGGRVVFDSVARIERSSFNGNSADRLGGALALLGSTVEVDDSVFARNEVSPGVTEPLAESLGAAIFAAPIVDFAGFDMAAHGSISRSDFSENLGLDIFDDDRAAGPINDIRYEDNRFEESNFGGLVYANTVAGVVLDITGLDELVVDRFAGVPSTDKASYAGPVVTSGVVTAALLAVPAAVPVEAAAGDAPDLASSFLTFTWSGAPAQLNGNPVSGGRGFVATSPGSHTLQVADLVVSSEVISVDRLFSDGFESGSAGFWSAVSD